MKKTLLTLAFALALPLAAQRSERLLTDGWRFHRGDVPQGQDPACDDRGWTSVSIPHDWAITGPFDRANDLQDVAVTQNGEQTASVKTGRTGGLPYVGVGWYRTTFTADTARRAVLIFDGAMSEARVYVNGREACFWPYGYNSFHCDVTPYLRADGRNVLAVRLENFPQSARWYPGAGLYRNVHLVQTERIHVPVWGVHITTPHVEAAYASVTVRTEVANADGRELTVVTDVVDADGKVVASKTNRGFIAHGRPFEQHLTVERPRRWSPETPHLYQAVTRVLVDGRRQDSVATTFGIRTIEFVADKGFFLNGERRKFRGVCNHHDLGPLGAAVDVSTLRHQLTLLREMGCDAIRTSHNMPAPELVRLCDEMGFMMMIEPFDEWDIAKCANGYHRYFDEWAERDMVNMLRHYRNNASVVMWSIGNEVPSQCSPEGYRTAKFLQDICHREDPTRPVTCGMDQVSCVLDNGFAALIDIPGFNYRAHRYDEAYARLPQNLLLGSETTSTVSSRGVYHFPVRLQADALHADHQSSSYDTEFCGWSNVPDVDFALAEDYDWTLGQFVWTGFDYLGEPSPYDTDAWPNHSSLFGIIDLASLPKDRYYLYRSVWNKKSPTLHVLPHWTWPGREGQTTPVFVYTSYPEAELFLNGKSLGRRRKTTEKLRDDVNRNAPNGYGTAAEWQENVLSRYRLMWNDVAYAPGELKVVAYDAAGRPAEEKTVRTAGRPARIVLQWANASDSAGTLRYVTATIVDKDGTPCPTDSTELSFSVRGAGRFKAAANGSPTDLTPFQSPRHRAFSGALTVIVAVDKAGAPVELTVSGKGLKSGTIKW